MSEQKTPVIVVLVGPPGSGKSTYAQQYIKDGFIHINQDSQGKEHLTIFQNSINYRFNIVVDRMNFNAEQRNRYLLPAKEAGYYTEIHVLHEPYDTCFDRIRFRFDHPTIKHTEDAEKALNFFFRNYERVKDGEALRVNRIWPEGEKPLAIWSDLDGTLCNVEHRRHFVRREGKKDWNSFFSHMGQDTVNKPIMDILNKFKDTHAIVYCSGRPDDWRDVTERWLRSNEAPSGPLFMRLKNDNRKDDIVKEMLLDFEVLTRFTPVFFLDDRDQVVRMLRARGLTVLQVADGNF